MKFKIVAHRGASGHAPENTFLAFSEAMQQGAEHIECDVHMTSDRKIVVIHDETIDRTSNGTGWVKDMTLKELRAFDFGSGETIPTLEELLSWAKTHPRVELFIEIKTDIFSYPGIETAVAAALVQTDMVSRAIVMSFDQAVVEKMRGLLPNGRVGALFDLHQCSDEEMLEIATKLQADYLGPSAVAIHPRLVSAAHHRGLQVIPWTVNELDLLKTVVSSEADGVITDYPGWAIQALQNIPK